MSNMSGSYPRGNYYPSYDRAPSKKQLGILKAGNLYISGRGMGWKSWKKRWFILTKTPTRTALVYFKGEPNGPINPSDALDGINLVNTGRVVAKLDKKMIILMFPDNRSYTFKADSLDELDGWRQMLEKALLDAPEPELEPEPEVYRSEPMDSSRDFSGEPPPHKKRPQKSLVIGRPILLALEDIDGSPSFLEKALRFIETTGLNVEGILRHSADVELVEKRVQAYEQGANEFGPNEDAHVIGDCIKHVLRELPSSPVPELCCTALIRAYRQQSRNAQVEEMRIAVADSFPEPNRRLLQRVLRMMLKVASNSAVNLMNADAVARCMAPLLLRPIFSGDVPIFVDDGQAAASNGEEHAMLQAMNAANVGGALIRAMMKEFDQIFMEDEHLTSATLSRSIDHSDDIYHRDTSHISFQTSIPSHLSRDSDASTSGIHSDVSNGVHLVMSGDVARVRHDLSGVSLAREGEASDTGGYSDAHIRVSDAHIRVSVAGQGVSDAVRRGDLDAVARVSDVGTDGEGHVPGVRGYSEEQELAVIERLSQQRDMLEEAVWKKKEENAGLKDGLRQRKQSLQDRRYELEAEVQRLKRALVNEVDQHAMLEIGMGAASAMLEHAKDLDPEAQAQLQEIVALEKDIARLRSQADDIQIQLQKRRGGGLANMDERLQRICDLNALQKQMEAELGQVVRKYTEEKEKNDELFAQIAAVDIAARETAYFKQQGVLAEAQEKLRLELSRAQLLQQRAGGLKEQQQRRGGATMLAGVTSPALAAGGSKGFGSVSLHSLDSDGADYLKAQLEAAGIVSASQEDEDRPQSRSSERPSSRSGDRPNSRSSERSVYSNGDSATTPTSTRSGATAFGTLDSQVAYSQERRTQLMRQLQELSSPTSSTPRRPLTYQQYRESVQYVVSP